MVAGDDTAWCEFHRRYGRLIYRCISKVTARFSKSIAAEEIREIYATLLLQLLSNNMHKLRTFDPSRGVRLGTWVGLLAIHAAHDHLRALRREPHHGPLSEAELLCSEEDDPAVELDRKTHGTLLQAALTELSDKDRQFVALYFGQGLDPEEVAVRMQISVRTVYSKKHKIRTRLERMLLRERQAA